jgi:hypothetical protein
MALPSASIISGIGCAIGLSTNPTDTAGEISISLGAVPTATFRVTFGYPFVNPKVIISPSTYAGAQNFVYLEVTATSTYFELNFNNVIPAGGVRYQYHVIDTQTSAAGSPFGLAATGTGYVSGSVDAGSTDVAGSLAFDPDGLVYGSAQTYFKTSYSVPPIVVLGPKLLSPDNMKYLWSGSGTTASGGSNLTNSFTTNWSTSMFGSPGGGLPVNSIFYHIIETQSANGGAPLAVAAGAAASSAAIYNCTDVAGNIRVNPNGSSGDLATITFKSAYPVAPRVVFSACDEISALFAGTIFAYTTTTSIIFSTGGTILYVGTPMTFAFHVI